MKNLKILLLVTVIATIAVMSCQKGATGATGPVGPAGPDSVIHSGWIVLNTPLNNSDSLYEETLNASSLTAPILDSGLVLSYIGVPNGSDTSVLTVSEAATLYGPISQELHVGSINLYSLFDYTGFLYRYVIIKGTTLVGRANGQVYTKDELEAMSYKDVQKLVN
ncbi:MAG TPA: hypothetical protein VHD35_03940 [Chitinophagaceae bacterium]|nr:hypothetical protein [Chitinophagaceae bacterium]